MASSRVATVVCLVLAVALVASPQVEAAITCGQVSSALAQCIPYLQGKVKVQPPACCNGIRNLNNAAKSTPDRQAACKCLKDVAAANTSINRSLAKALPAKCGVNVPYEIAPTTDCAKVQ